jgi:hypothetical protein
VRCGTKAASIPHFVLNFVAATLYTPHIGNDAWIGVCFVKYLPPFEVLKSYVSISAGTGELVVNCGYEDFVGLIRRLIAGVEVDDAWYLDRYPDIADAIGKGIVPSPRAHFVNDGYFEGRWPFAIKVDEDYYLKQNSGVAEYVANGNLASGQQHFDENGYREGRLPFGL